MKTFWKLLLGFMIKLILFMFLIATCYYSFLRLNDTKNWVLHTHDVLDKAQSVLIDLLNIETGVRGFAITGKEEFLDPLREGMRSIQSDMESIKDLTRDNPAQQKNLDTLKDQYHSWIAIGIDPLLALRQEEKDRARLEQEIREFISSKRGKDLFDAMRVTLGRIKQEEEALLEKRDLAMGDLQSLTQNILPVGGATACVIGVAIALLTSLSISRPLRKITDYAKRVASGDYSAPPGLERKDELGILDNAVRVMVAQLNQRFNTLTHLNRELQDFTYTASHDLQEPLRKIQTFSGRLRLTSGGCLNESGLDSLVRMENSAKRMQELIDALLAYSRISTMHVPLRPVDLNTVAKEAIGDLEVRVAETGGRIEVEDLPTIEADATQMFHLFQNLFSNALKYHRPDTPPVIQVRWRYLDGNPEMCEISVADNGIGFDEKYLGKIFTPFQRLHTNKQFQGTGIGLTICRKIVERHNGTITARSEPGKGTTFIVALPVKHEKARAHPLAVSPPS